MVFEGFLEVRTHNGANYQWEDITDKLVSFSDITESCRDKRTGENAANSFTVIVKNNDGFWIDLENANELGKRLNNGTDSYSKTLRHRRIRVGVYKKTGTIKTKQPWATGRIVNYTTNTETQTVELSCETLEAEASELKCDTNSDNDSVYGDYGIRGHIVSYDEEYNEGYVSIENGDFTDSEYALYRSKVRDDNADDFSTLLSCFQSVRVNDILTRISNVMDVNGEEGTQESVIKKAYKLNSTTQDYERRRAIDQIQTLDQYAFANFTTTECELLLSIGDPETGNFVYLFQNGDAGVARNTFLSYYNYATNTYRKFINLYTIHDKFLQIANCKLPSRSELRDGWYNSYTKTFQWLAWENALSVLSVYNYNPETNAVTHYKLKIRYLGATITPDAFLCFAQTTTGNSGHGSIFVYKNQASPAVSATIWELDLTAYDAVNDWWSTFVLGPITDPNFAGADQAPNPGRETHLIWGKYLGTAASLYDVYGTCSATANGLIIAVNRTSASKGYAALWIDLYNSRGGGAGEGFLIWEDSTAVDKMSLTQKIFTTIDPSAAHEVLLPLQKVSPAGYYTLVLFPNAAWSTNNPSASGAVSGNGESKHAYYDETGGHGCIVPAAYEDIDTDISSDTKYTRYYFWCNRYYGANGTGKIQSTDGANLRAENKSIPSSRYGDTFYGNYDNCFPATNISFSTGGDGTLLLSGGFYNSDELVDRNYLFFYGWDIKYTLPLFDVSDLSITTCLANISQLTQYDWWFNENSALCFIDKRPDNPPASWTLSNVLKASIESPGFNFSEVTNKISIIPWEIAYANNTSYNTIVYPFRKNVQGNFYCKQLRINPNCNEHLLIKVQMTTATGTIPQSSVEATVYEWDTGTNAWVANGVAFKPMSADFHDTINSDFYYLYHQEDWVIGGNVAGQVQGDYTLFYTMPPRFILQQCDSSVFNYQIEDVQSMHDYGVSEMSISDNRFITKIDIPLLSYNLLNQLKLPKKIVNISIPIEHDCPAIGDSVYFESSQLRITKAQEWRVLSRTRSLTQAIQLRLEKIN